jgi:hypothetical protein
MADKRRTGRARPARFWPFGPQTAVLLVPLLLTVQLVAWGLAGESLGFDTVRAVQYSSGSSRSASSPWSCSCWRTWP